MNDQTQPQGQLTIRVLAMPADTNANGDIFGGWLVSNMDLAGLSEAMRRASSRAVTVAIDTLTFIKPVEVGDVVSCYTQLNIVGRTSMQFSLEAWTISLTHTTLMKVAAGTFTYVAVDEHGVPHPVDR